MTSQCSTIRPSSTRKISTMALPGSAALSLECVWMTTRSSSAITRFRVDDALGILLEEGLEEARERRRPVGDAWIMLDVDAAQVQIRSLLRPMLPEGQVVEGQHEAFVVVGSSRRDSRDDRQQYRAGQPGYGAHVWDSVRDVGSAADRGARGRESEVLATMSRPASPTSPVNAPDLANLGRVSTPRWLVFPSTSRLPDGDHAGGVQHMTAGRNDGPKHKPIQPGFRM